MSALGTQLAQIQNRIDAGNLLCESHINGRTAIDDQQEILILLRTETDGFQFLVRQEEIAFFRFPVAALTSLTAEDIDTGIGSAFLHILSSNQTACGGAEIVEKHAHDGIKLQQINTLFLFDLVCGLCLGIMLFKIIDPPVGSHLKAPVLKALQNGDGVAFVNLTGTGAAFDGHGCAGTIEGHFFCFKRKSTVIFQKHHTLAGSLIGNLQIFLFPLGYLGRIACFGQQFHRIPS